jgi:hypothetical protein
LARRQVTRIERTLVDLVDVMSAGEVMRVTDGLKAIDRDRLAATLDRAGPRKARSALARSDDHARDAKLQLAGFATLRVTWIEVRHRPELGVARIRPFL